MGDVIHRDAWYDVNNRMKETMKTMLKIVIMTSKSELLSSDIYVIISDLY